MVRTFVFVPVLCMYEKMHKSLYQARSRVQDSSQKLDLLRLSLEHRLGESAQEALREPVTKQGLPTVSPPPEGQQQNCLLCSFPSSTSSSFLKPASLTGNYSLQTLQVLYVCLWKQNDNVYFKACSPDTCNILQAHLRSCFWDVRTC